MKKLCVIGLGYIGLPTSAMFALSGHKVIGVDVSEHIVETLNNGLVHIEEPGLDKVVSMMVKSGNIVAQTTPEAADAFIIAVPTPHTADNKCDLSYVVSATRAIIPYLEKGNVVIIESTIAPRTTVDVVMPLIEEAGFVIGKDIFLSHCPERVLPGKIMEELVENNRLVGGCTTLCAEKAAELYRSFVKGEIIISDSKTAEMSKLMENTFRDVNIALANELVKVCMDLEINALDVISMANKHPRVNIHQPGPGVGGHCLAVDPYFIVEKAPDKANIIALSRETNNSMPKFVLDQVTELTQGIAKPVISVFGITYKGNIDDMRESPAMEIIELLNEQGFNVKVHDPHVVTEELVLLDAKEAVKESDLILILADHDEFKDMNYEELAKLMNTAQVLDTKNILDIKAYNDSVVEVINFGNLPQKLANNKEKKLVI